MDIAAEAFQRAGVEHLRCDGDSPTEARVARLFVEKYSGQIAYCPEQSRWYTRENEEVALWSMDVANKVRTFLADFIYQQSARYGSRHAQSLQRAAFLNGVESLARCDTRLKLLVPDMDADDHIIGTPCGAYDLRTAKAIDSYQGVLTKSTAVAPSFDEPELWLQLLEDWCDSKELRELLWLLAGYWSTGSTREQRAVILHGPAKSGKSTFTNTIHRVLGNYAIVAPVELFLTSGIREHPTMTASLRAARFALVHEIPAGARFNEPLFKTVVAGDPLSARYMRGDYFDFQPRVKVVFSANHLPSMTSHESMRRRILVVPFIRKISEAARDKGLQERLISAEAPRILGWILRGARRWYAEGLPNVTMVDEASENYFEDADVLGLWIEDCLDLGRDYFASSKDLFKSWETWARDNGERGGTMKAMSSRLKERGYPCGRNTTGNVRGFHGLRVR